MINLVRVVLSKTYIGIMYVTANETSGKMMLSNPLTDAELNASHCNQ